MKVWLNGRIVHAKGAIDADERGVLLGDGLFETLAVFDGKPLRIDRHMARLVSGARLLGMALQYDRAALDGAVRDVAAATGVAEGSARITLLRGPAPRGVLPPDDPTPTLVVQVHPGTLAAANAISAIIATATRRNERSPLSAVKSTNYLDAILARAEAARAGADEAILLNTRDRVAEASAANLFCLIGGQLVTPPVADGALPGVMRACVIEREEVIERTLGADDLRHAEEIMLTSSLAVRPVTLLDGAAVGDGRPGKVWARLSELPKTAV